MGEGIGAMQDEKSVMKIILDNTGIFVIKFIVHLFNDIQTATGFINIIIHSSLDSNCFFI
jgi:hypothetical protein